MTGHRPLGSGSGWGPALRVARRELLRAKGRTLLVLLMVLLPVTAVVGLDTLLRTSELTAAERLPQELGGAEARIELQAGGRVVQSPELDQHAQYGSGTNDPRALRVQQSDVAAVLAPSARLLPVRESLVERPVRTPDDRTARVVLLGVDLTDPSLDGPFRVVEGRAPRRAGEVAVSPRVAEFGFPVGGLLRLPDDGVRTVVGVVDAPVPYPGSSAVLGLPSAVALADLLPRRYYVSGAEVSWQDVQELNALGAFVLSRAVVLDPPDVPDLDGYQGVDETVVAVIALIAVIAVLEVVLLAGPAFAVGARRQRRALALMAAGGAEPRHVRRVVLAQGLLVGVTAAVLAAVLGVGGAALARAPLTRYAGAAWGPFEVSVRDVVLVCLLGAGTALLAAVAPAVTAAREPVVVALQGRRAVAARAWAPALLGLLLLGVGLLVLLQALSRYQAELWVASAAVPTVLGAALLAPAALAGLGRLAGRLPLPLRFALRDADRQRARTAPAVAAVTATVAGVVALGIAHASDAQEQRAQETQGRLTGTAVVTVHGAGADLPAVARAAHAALPGERVVEVPGLQTAPPADLEAPYPAVQVCRPGEPASVTCEGYSSSYSGGLGSDVLVGEAGLEAVAPQLDPGSLVAARRALAEGSALVAGVPAGERVSLRRVLLRTDGGTERATLVAAATVVAQPLGGPGGVAPVRVVVPEEVGARLGGVGTVGLLVGDDLSRAQERRLQDAVARVDTSASAYVERPQRDGDALVALLLFGAAGLLVLGGTLAATSLALAEAQPDLVTLGSVGAPPRTRRTVAAAYAFVLALVGAVLGCLAGAAPGVAAAAALTRDAAAVGGAGPGLVAPGGSAHLDVPWLLLLGLVVVLPLVAGAVAGLSVRSTLPGLGRRVRA